MQPSVRVEVFLRAYEVEPGPAGNPPQRLIRLRGDNDWRGRPVSVLRPGCRDQFFGQANDCRELLRSAHKAVPVG